MPSLHWIGKEAVVNHHNAVPFHLLRDVPELSVGAPGAGNLIVQGDNLVALKALLPYYAGKVKCVLTDPPYNTGSKTEQGWTYSDNVDHPTIRNWLNKFVGDEDEDLTRHDKWLCMMYPRLQLLKRFLKPDGVILIHIGRDELGNLKTICDEIFDAKNLIEILIWNTHGHTENQEEITGVHEYILVYARNKALARIRNIVDPNVPEDSKIRRAFAENSITKNGPKNPPSIVELPKGFPCEIEKLELDRMAEFDEFHRQVTSLGYISREITKQFDAAYPVRQDKMLVESHSLKVPCRVFTGWSSADKLKEFIANQSQPIDDNGTTLRFFLSKNGVIYYRREGRENHYVESVLTNMGTTETNRYYLESMGVKFTYPKPIELTKYLISLYTEGTDIVLDSFVGSGTTLEGTLQQNKLDDQKRQFVGIEMDETNARNALQKRLSFVINGFTPMSGKFEGRRIAGLGGGFRFCELGEPLFDETGKIRESVRFAELARHVYFTETGEPLPELVAAGVSRLTSKSGAKDSQSRLTSAATRNKTPVLGIHNGRAVCLLYNGILKDRSPDGGNALTQSTLALLRAACDGQQVERLIVYGTSQRLSAARLKREGVEFKQIPYSIRIT